MSYAFYYFYNNAVYRSNFFDDPEDYLTTDFYTTVFSKFYECSNNSSTTDINFTGVEIGSNSIIIHFDKEVIPVYSCALEHNNCENYFEYNSAYHGTEFSSVFFNCNYIFIDYILKSYNRFPLNNYIDFNHSASDSITYYSPDYFCSNNYYYNDYQPIYNRTTGEFIENYVSNTDCVVNTSTKTVHVLIDSTNNSFVYYERSNSVPYNNFNFNHRFECYIPIGIYDKFKLADIFGFVMNKYVVDSYGSKAYYNYPFTYYCHVQSNQMKLVNYRGLYSNTGPHSDFKICNGNFNNVLFLKNIPQSEDKNPTSHSEFVGNMQFSFGNTIGNVFLTSGATIYYTKYAELNLGDNCYDFMNMFSGMYYNALDNSYTSFTRASNTIRIDTKTGSSRSPFYFSVIFENPVTLLYSFYNPLISLDLITTGVEYNKSNKGYYRSDYNIYSRYQETLRTTHNFFHVHFIYYDNTPCEVNGEIIANFIKVVSYNAYIYKNTVFCRNINQTIRLNNIQCDLPIGTYNKYHFIEAIITGFVKLNSEYTSMTYTVIGNKFNIQSYRSFSITSNTSLYYSPPTTSSKNSTYYTQGLTSVINLPVLTSENIAGITYLPDPGNDNNSLKLLLFADTLTEMIDKDNNIIPLGIESIQNDDNSITINFGSPLTLLRSYTTDNADNINVDIFNKVYTNRIETSETFYRTFLSYYSTPVFKNNITLYFSGDYYFTETELLPFNFSEYYTVDNINYIVNDNGTLVNYYKVNSNNNSLTFKLRFNDHVDTVSLGLGIFPINLLALNTALSMNTGYSFHGLESWDYYTYSVDNNLVSIINNRTHPPAKDLDFYFITNDNTAFNSIDFFKYSCDNSVYQQTQTFRVFPTAFENVPGYNCYAYDYANTSIRFFVYDNTITESNYDLIKLNIMNSFRITPGTTIDFTDNSFTVSFDKTYRFYWSYDNTMSPGLEYSQNYCNYFRNNVLTNTLTIYYTGVYLPDYINNTFEEYHGVTDIVFNGIAYGLIEGNKIVINDNTYTFGKIFDNRINLAKYIAKIIGNYSEIICNDKGENIIRWECSGNVSEFISGPKFFNVVPRNYPDYIYSVISPDIVIIAENCCNFKVNDTIVTIDNCDYNENSVLAKFNETLEACNFQVELRNNIFYIRNTVEGNTNVLSNSDINPLNKCLFFKNFNFNFNAPDIVGSGRILI